MKVLDRSLRLSVLGWAFCASAAVARGACSQETPTGLFEGTARSADGKDSFEITLNLSCADDRYTVQFFTSIGDFPAIEPVYERGHLRGRFDSPAALGSFDIVCQSPRLTGAFVLADDRGTIALVRKSDALPRDALAPRMGLTPEQWQEDLQFLARELPRRHANAFFSLSRGAFKAEVAALNAHLDRADSDAIFVGLQQIVRSIGDGHTGMQAPPDRRVMPLTVARFGDEFRVTGCGPGLEEALGARITTIDAVPILEAWRRVLTLTPQSELMELREGDALVYLTRGYALHGLGIIQNRDRATYTLQNDSGGIFTKDVRGLAEGETVRMKSAYSDQALRFQNAQEPFWCKRLGQERATYCAWHSYQDLRVKAGAMFDLLTPGMAQKLIIDMRDNGGGDNTVGEAEVVRPIRARPDLNKRGRLYVLIGPLTFSAAMNNAAQFHDETNAILVGQTIGEKPNSYQEPRQFRLPHSHLIVRASTRWYAFRKRGENAVRPNKEIVPTWSDVKAGRDPVLEWVLAEPLV